MNAIEIETTQDAIEIVNESIDRLLLSVAQSSKESGEKRYYRGQALAMVHLSIRLGIIPNDERNLYVSRIANSK